MMGWAIGALAMGGGGGGGRLIADLAHDVVTAVNMDDIACQ